MANQAASAPTEKRKPGRPASGKSVLSRESVLAAAEAMLTEVGLEGFSLRALSRKLGVDAMALYHYYPSKKALLEALANKHYASLCVPYLSDCSVDARIEALAVAYLRVLSKVSGLLRYLAQHPRSAREPSQVFEREFRRAVAPLRLSPEQRRLALYTLVDLLHGFSLGVRGTPTARHERALKRELELYWLGLSAYAACAQKREPAARKASPRERSFA